MDSLETAQDTISIRSRIAVFIQNARAFLTGRFLGFGLVGAIIMLVGFVLLYGLVHYCHMNKNIAYFIQAIVSIELNFVCNRFFNWRDRRGALALQWVRFHTTKIGTVILNQLLFGLLVAWGIHYLIATLIGVALATVINYILNDRFVFISGKAVAQVNKPV